MLVARDPSAPHRAAPFLIQLVACGLVGRAEALAALLHASAPAQVSPCLRHARLGSMPAAIAISEGAPIQTSSRSNAAKAARAALMLLLRSNAPRATLALAAMRAASPTLEPAEIQGLIAGEVARHLRQRRQSPQTRPHPSP
jgi:hypothetical protein